MRDEGGGWKVGAQVLPLLTRRASAQWMDSPPAKKLKLEHPLQAVETQSFSSDSLADYLDGFEYVQSVCSVALLVGLAHALSYPFWAQRREALDCPPGVMYAQLMLRCCVFFFW